mmetsp:Transcript_13734/g.43183  ORF Transcript_13734/g.43183 Transcript_13734/m.43183 type:complete len:302 (+) Transcript_13734:92-997(+)
MPDARVAVVTGANTGIGLETAKALCAEGFEVVLACRSEDKAAQAMDVIKQANPAAKVTFIPLDTASLASAKAFATAFVGRHCRIDALVLNAGTGYVKKEQRTTADGNEAILQINFLSHFLLTQCLLPLLQKTADARVVCLTSVAHREALTADWEELNSKTVEASYASSKLAMALFAFELVNRTGLLAAAVNPGAVASDIWRYMDGRRGVYAAVHGWVQRSLMLTPEQGSATSVYAATAPLPKGECVYASPYAEWPLFPHASDYVCPFNGPTLRRADEKAYDRAAQQRLWEWSIGKCEQWLP